MAVRFDDHLKFARISGRDGGLALSEDNVIRKTLKWRTPRPLPMTQVTHVKVVVSRRRNLRRHQAGRSQRESLAVLATEVALFLRVGQVAIF